MTKKEMFALIATVNADNEEIVAFCNKEIEHLNARKSSNSLTKTQKENIEVKDAIVNALASAEKALTVTELQQTNVDMAQYSNQKLSALLRQLVADGKVVKTIEGKKAYFALV